MIIIIIDRYQNASERKKYKNGNAFMYRHNSIFIKGIEILPLTLILKFLYLFNPML